MKFSASHGVYHLVTKHQILLVLMRNDDTLFSRESPRFADAEKPFDFLVHATDGLNFSLLINGTRNGEVLSDRSFCETGDDRINFCGRCTIAIHSAIRLFERETCVHGERSLLSVHAVEIAAENEHPFVMRGSAHRDLAFDIDDALIADGCGCGDACRFTERILTHVVHG